MATKPAARPGRKPAEEYIFRPFNDASLAATRDAWTQDAAKGEAFTPEIEQAMEWAEKHTTLTDNEMAYGVFRKAEKVALGICELAITKPTTRGKWVKFIRLRLRPEIEGQIFSNDPRGLSAALNAYVAAVLGVYHVKNVHEATIIKIYGRTQEQMRFLTVLLTELEKRPEAALKAQIAGRWLTLNWGKS